MADIRLILPDLDKELNVAQDRQFPLALNYTAGSFKDVNLRQSDFSLELRIPANKKNKTALNHLNSTNVFDGSSILASTRCVVTADNFPIFEGDFKLLGTVNDRGFEEFKCILLGSAMDWAKGMSNKTLQSYEWGTIDITQSDIKSTWGHTYNQGYVFPLINYGKWSQSDRVFPIDLRPAVFMRSLFEKAFNAEGYTLVTGGADDFFGNSTADEENNIIIPFTGENWKMSSSDVNDYDFSATSEPKVYKWDTWVKAQYSLVNSVTRKDVNTSTPANKTNISPASNYNAGNCYRYAISGDVVSELDSNAL